MLKYNSKQVNVLVSRYYLIVVSLVFELKTKHHHAASKKKKHYFKTTQGVSMCINLVFVSIFLFCFLFV